MNKILSKQFVRKVEAYVDDMPMKSEKADKRLTNLEETFQVFWEFSMYLNPSKCPFRVKLGIFLSFMVTQRGIEENSKKIRVNLEMSSPPTLGNSQWLKN